MMKLLLGNQVLLWKHASNDDIRNAHFFEKYLDIQRKEL